MKKKKVAALILTAAIVTGMFASCSTPSTRKSGGSSGTEKQVFKFSMKTEPPTLDPQLSNSMISSTLDNELYDGLLRNDNGKIEPAGAESYTVSKDGLVYTFKLRQGEKWSDGKEVVADDYVYGLKRLMDPKTASPYSYSGEVIKNGVAVETGKKPVDQLGVKALDKYTVQITLEGPCAYFAEEVCTDSYMPARKDLVEKYGKSYNMDPSKSVYNGPFVLKSWAHNDKLVFTKNKTYWNSSIVKLDEVDVSIISSSNTALGMYESGQLDYVDLDSAIASKYSDAKSYSNGAVTYLQFNMKKNPYYANKNFRLALSNSIDRQNYVKLARNSTDVPASRIVLPSVNSATNGVSYGSAYPYIGFNTKADTAKAKEYLKKAMAELGISSASKISLTLACTDADSDVKCAEVIQSQIQSVLGIKISIKQFSYKQFYDNQAKNDFEMMYTGWCPDYPDPNTYLNLWMTDSTYNHTFYNNKDYDNLMNTANSITDLKKRMDTLFTAEKKFCEDAVAIPLSINETKYLVNSKVKNFNVYFVGYNQNFTTTYIQK